MELFLVYPSSSWQSVFSTNSWSLPLIFPLQHCCSPSTPGKLPELLSSHVQTHSQPPVWSHGRAATFPSLNSGWMRSLWLPTGIKVPGYAMAAPAAVMVENNLDFICLLGGDVSAVEHLCPHSHSRCPALQQDLPWPSLQSPRAAPSSGWDTEPLHSPKPNHWDSPSWVGFPWIS